MSATNDALNEAADGVVLDSIQLHSGDPGSDGTSNVITGTMTDVTYGAATDGVREVDTPVDITVPGGSTVSHYSVWGAGTLKTYNSFPNSESYNGEGIARIDTAEFSVTSGT